METVIKSNDPEEIVKAITSTVQPSPNKVISASRVFAGMIKNYMPKLGFTDQENFAGVNYTLTVLDGGDDGFDEAVPGTDLTSGDNVTNIGKQGEMKHLKRGYDIAAQVYRDDYMNLGVNAMQSKILDFVARKVAKNKVRMVWLGDTTADPATKLNHFDGFAKLIANDAATVKVDATTATGSAATTWKAALTEAVQNIPEDYDEDEYTIFLNKRNYESFREEMGSGDNSLALTILLDGRKLTFDAKQFVQIPGLNDGKVYLARKQDLVVIDGEFSITPVDHMAEKDIMRFIYKAWMHANLRLAKAIVELTVDSTLGA